MSGDIVIEGCASLDSVMLARESSAADEVEASSELGVVTGADAEEFARLRGMMRTLVKKKKCSES